jgi:hypothetical protein
MTQFTLEPAQIAEHYGRGPWTFRDKNGDLERIAGQDHFFLNSTACSVLRDMIEKELGRPLSQSEVASETNVRGKNERARQRRYSGYEQNEDPVPIEVGCRIVEYLVRMANLHGIDIHWEDLLADQVTRTDFRPRSGGVVDRVR